MKDLSLFGFIAFCGLLLFIFALSTAIYKITTDRAVIEHLKHENKSLTSEVDTLQRLYNRRNK